jgi:bifunctional non-homologous end joining protein LigD
MAAKKRAKAPSAGSALAKYQAMRDFERTPEPSGRKAPKRGGKRLSFVVQMHHATRLHWDFRLEADGVLKSWAVPKGPTLALGEKRLAMHVEDHPFAYRTFEGIIPSGYGAGEVIVWDRGTYRLLEGTDPTQQIAKGSLKFELFGKKLRGGFALVKIKSRDGNENTWLLIKERDEFVDPKWRIEDHAESVKSGKTLADIKRDPRAPHWQSNRPAAKSAPKRSVLAAKKVAPLPRIVSPMLATAVDTPFDDKRWLFELKWDGYRALATIDRAGKLALVSRNAKDFAPKFPEFATLSESFSERPLIVDGEIVVLDKAGRPSFGALQERLDRFGRINPSNFAVTFVVFDLLYGNGRDLRKEPLEKRKAILESLLTGKGPVLYSKHVLGDGKQLFALAAKRGLEGIVAKRRDSAYEERRSKAWLKIKANLRQECVIGGWTEARGSRKYFGALLLGIYDKKKNFVYVGAVGTGFDSATLREIHGQLKPIERATPPFANPPKTETAAHWVKPQLVAEVRFTEWTRDGVMRHPAFLGMRVDKPARSVGRERPAPTANVT